MDAQAIASTLSESIEQPVEVYEQYGVLVLKVKSVDVKLGDRIIALLPTSSKTVQISGTGWTKFFTLTNGKYQENSGAVVLVGIGIVGAIAFVIGVGIFYKPPAPVAAPPVSVRTFIGTGPTGYEIWQDKSCVYIKGLRESDLQRMNTDLNGVKKVVKEQTGYSCVLFE
ncbi:hypothetical protein [Nostoc sp.]|uniref:hypothetical protein n=1 Tax=Nostoc sp. TaxID=1180 RepID=UPI002FF7EC65